MTTTPNMGLTLPEPGVTPAPDWGSQQAASGQLIDRHDHTTGKGVQVPTAGININDDLSMAGYTVREAGGVSFVSPTTVTDLQLYVDNVNLWYRDGDGHDIQITAGGAVNGGGGGTGGATTFFVSTTVAAMRGLPSTSRSQDFTYRTLGYGAVFDGGGAMYQWNGAESRDDDGAFCIKPDDVDPLAPGRFLYILRDGVFDAEASSIAATGLEADGPQGMKLWGLWKSAPSFGCHKILLPSGPIEVRDLVGDSNDSRVRGIRDCALEGRGQGKTVLRTYVMMEGELPTKVHVATQAALPAYVAAGAGIGKTLTMVANGRITVDTRMIATNDRVLVRHAVLPKDNGVYLCTQQGIPGLAPCILTRATDLDSNNSLVQRLGVRTTDGSVSTKYLAYVLSALPNEYYSADPMVIDVTPQYWTAERFIGAHFMVWPGTELLLFGYAQPAYPPTHWTERVLAGQTVMHNVQGMAGGPWVSPDNGVTYNISPLAVGNQVFIKQGGTSTDQGQWWYGYKARVLSIDRVTNDVVFDTPSQQTSPMVFSAGTPGAVAGVGNYDTTKWQIGQISAVGANTVTLSPAYLAGGYKIGDNLYTDPAAIGGSYRAGTGIVTNADPGTGIVTVSGGTLPVGTIPGDYAFHDGSFPNNNENKAQHTNDNAYFKITEDVCNLEISNLTLDGVSFNLGFVTNLYVHDVEVKNCHAGTFFSGCMRHRVERLHMKNISGFNFANEVSPSAFCFYGWAFQNNFCADSTYRDISVDGISCDLMDQEGENETTGYSLTARFVDAPVVKPAIAIIGTTPNCQRKNPWVNVSVYGDALAFPTLGEPVHNLNFSLQNAPQAVSGFGGGGAGNFSGILRFKDRMYDMNKRRPWRFRLPLTGPATRVLTKPWKGLWSNTRIYAPTIQGITSLLFAPTVVTSTDLLTILQSNFIANRWVSVGCDEFILTYPNASDNDLQTLTIATDGTVPAGAYLIFETEIILPTDRGDGYQGTSFLNLTQIPPLAGQQVITDDSIPFSVYRNGSPVGAVQPGWPGQECYDYSVPAKWEAYDVLNNTNWKQVY